MKKVHPVSDVVVVAFHCYKKEHKYMHATGTIFLKQPLAHPQSRLHNFLLENRRDYRGPLLTLQNPRLNDSELSIDPLPTNDDQQQDIIIRMELALWSVLVTMRL